MATPHASDMHALDRAITALNRGRGMKAPRSITGTITATNASTAVSASGGAFLTELEPGDSLHFANEQGVYYKIASITDNDNLVLASAFQGTTGAQTTWAMTGVCGVGTIAGVSNPGTIDGLCDAIEAKSVHASDAWALTSVASALRIAGEPMFSLAAPTIGNVTTATSGGSLADNTAYYYRVVAVDVNGNLSLPSSEDDVTTGTPGTNLNANTIPWTDSTGAFKIRVYRGTATGVYTFYKEVDDAASTTHVSDTGWTACSETTASLSAASGIYGTGGFGLLTQDMVDDARDQTDNTNFTNLRNAVADQHVLGSTARTYDWSLSLPFPAT